MFEFMKSPIMNKVLKKVSGDTETSQSSCYNPFDSDDELETIPSKAVEPARQVTFERKVTAPVSSSTNPFDEDDDDDHDRDANKGGSPSSLVSSPAFPISRDKCRSDLQERSKLENQSVHGLKNQVVYKAEETTKTANGWLKIAGNIKMVDCDAKKEDLLVVTSSACPTSTNRYKRDFQEARSSENESVQELENRAVCKAEETTKTVRGCLKIAGDIREDATQTLVMLNHQGEEIIRTHRMATDIDKDLSRGEKLLSSLGGLFSKTWNPKKTRDIIGPQVILDNASDRSEDQLEQRCKLGIVQMPKAQLSNRASIPEPNNAIQKVEVEWDKQDDVLSDLSNILGDLKNMAVDMGSEIDRHNKALGHLGDDVDELNFRVKGANQRARRLLVK